jgi:hypothetical protein
MKTEYELNGLLKKKMSEAEKAELLAYVAEKLKGRDLFPERTAEAREFMKNAKFVPLKKGSKLR